MNARTAVLVLVGLAFVEGAFGLRTVPLDKWLLISTNGCTEVDLQRAAMGFPVECMQSQHSQTAMAQDSRGHAVPLQLGNYRQLQSAKSAGTAATTTTPARKLLDLGYCSEAERVRASMGFNMECMHDHWYDRSWRRGFFDTNFVRPRGNRYSG